MEEDGKRVRAEINETVGEALFVRLDVTSESDWQQDFGFAEVDDTNDAVAS